MAVLAAATPSRADAFSDALAKFAADDYTETIDGIEAVTASGHAQAVSVISALAEGRLLFNEAKLVVIRDKSGTLLDPLTGKALQGAAPDDLKPVRLNNRVRRALEAALGSLTLLSSNPATRFDAAQAVFKSRDTNALPAVEAALAKETHPRIKRALAEARAAILFLKADAPEAQRIEAVAVLAARGDQDSMSLLRSLPGDAPPALKRAADAAIASVERGLVFWDFGQNVWYGVSLGSVLLLAAIGLAITFGVMGVINMAHGEMVMLGAFVTFQVQEWIREYNPALFDWSLAIAVPLAFLVAGAVGV
ncbi:MAG TPA: urea ABC transporter permease subunit UrtB, partial [Xanthobacteraceae bacterium]|nr:urea ABC transporter permease subunit UrtB [Xanthobacteraceae bacterium]